MGSCTGRHFLLTICVLQLIVVIECQVFDFMGFMYGPILANFFHIILIILGFFGTFQYSPRYILAYSLWNVFWVGWNIFVICFYLDAGELDKNSDILNLGTGSRSWFEIHGINCMADFTTAIINGSVLEHDPDPSRPPKPTKVEGCLIEYQYVEVIQASIQCLLSVLGIMGGLFISKTYLEEDDSSQAKENQQRTALSPIDYNYQTSRRHLDQYQQQAGLNGYGPQQVSPRPMTPRRVKRRSVLARDTMNRTSHRRQGSSRSRTSQRRTRPHQSPVTRLLEQQNRYLDPVNFNDPNRLNSTTSIPSEAGNQDLRYFKTGLSNPVFQQSSNSSINQSGADEIYRPTSARSSYSNYHASRPISYLHNNEYFSNQAVAQIPINTNRNKSNTPNEDSQNNLQPNLNTTTLKSFSHKNFNFLGFNLKNNNVNNNVASNNNNNNNNNNEPPSVRNEGTVRNSKRFRADLTRTTNRASNAFFSQGPPAYREGAPIDSETVI